MRILKRWFALALALSIVFGDCGSIAALAAGDTITEDTGEVENLETESDTSILQEETNEDIVSDETQPYYESVSEEDIFSETNTETVAPILHIGQIKDGKGFPYAEDAEFEYDLPVSFGTSDSVTLFAAYIADGQPENQEETGRFVWSILRGSDGMKAGSVNLVNEEDDWTGFEAVSASPYFTIIKDEETTESGHGETVKLVSTGVTGQDGYSYYIRAAYYLGTGEGTEEKFYEAVTVAFLPEENTDIPEAEETRSDIEDETKGDTEEETLSDTEAETQSDAEQETWADEIQEDMTDEGETAADAVNEEALSEEDGDIVSVSGNAVTKEETASFENGDAGQDSGQTDIRLTLSPNELSMKPGDTQALTVTVEPEDTQVKILWKSSDERIAVVDADGVVTAKEDGYAEITAECGELLAAVSVEVAAKRDEYGNAEKLLDLSGDIWVAGFEKESDDLVYTGGKITQDIRVYHDKTLLKEKTDYTLSYKNNVNAAEWNSLKAPSVTIKLKGQYSGSVTLYYTIKPKRLEEIAGGDVSGNSQPGYEQAVVYKKKLSIPNPELKFGTMKLKANKDFVCDYTPDRESYPDLLAEGEILPKGCDYKDGDSYVPGTVYNYIVNGTGNFTGSVKMRLVVVKDKSLNFGSAVVKLDQKEYEYHGTELPKSDVKITMLKLNNQVLDEKLYDYEVCAKEIKGAYVTVYPTDAGKAAGYRGYKKVTLKLVGDRKITDAVMGENWKESLIFSQTKVNKEGGIFQEKTGLLTFGSGEGKEALEEGTDYIIKYSNAKKAGKVTVTFTGMGRYKGSLKKQYVIEPYEDDLRIVWKNVKEKDGVFEVAYQKGGAVPDFVLKDRDNNILKNKTDYTVKLKNNTSLGSTMSCEVTGKGNYKGYSKTVELKVTPGDIGKGTISIADRAYSEKADAWKSKVVIKDVNGKTLAAGKDYSKEFVYEFAGMENGQNPQAGTTIRITVRGMGCYEGSEITGSYRIFATNINKLKIKIDAQEYTGEEITLSPPPHSSDIHVYATAADMNHNNPLLEDCYEIVEYKNNIKAGTAKVVLRGIGNYGGTRTCSFKIQKKEYKLNHVKKITLDKSVLSMRLSEQAMSLTATLIPENEGQTIANSTIIWSVSNSDVAAIGVPDISDGSSTIVITPLKEGTVTITATAQDGNKKVQCKVSIVDAPLLKEAGQTIEGKAGETYQLTVEWAENQTPRPEILKWESNNPDRVSVDAKSGLVTMKKRGAAVITLRVGGYAQQCDVVVKGDGQDVLPEGKILKYEKQPGTLDDTPAINDLLRQWERNPDEWDYFYLPDGIYRIDAVSGFGGIVLTDNQKLIMSPGALLMAIGNSSSDDFQMIYAFGRDNITISGGQIIGERREHKGSSGESGHGIHIAGCTNVLIENVEVSYCWGDGIYLASYWGSTYVSDTIKIENCNLHHNRRNNLSITDASHVIIDHCQFNNANGTDPQFGIDIEPNYADKNTCKDIKIYNSTFTGNQKAAMGIMTTADGVRLENCTLNGNFYNWAGKNVVLKNTRITGDVVDHAGSIRYE